MVNWQYFPKSTAIAPHLVPLVDVFNKHEPSIKSPGNQLSSNQVLSVLKCDLVSVGFCVEKSKTAEGKIRVPVLFGRNGKFEKSFDADAYQEETKTVLEVEAGRGVTNYQFLKDLFQACMMHEVHFLAIAVRNSYRKSPDFERVNSFFDALYASGRLNLPLKGILLIGY